MPIPFLPILALAGLGGGLFYLFSQDSQDSKPAPLEVITFEDRGYVIRVVERHPRWEWRVTREGHKTKSGLTDSKDAAISAAVAWISSRMLPPVEPTRPAGGEDSHEPERPTPPIPTPQPVGSGEPEPGAWAGAVIQRSGLRLQRGGKTLQLTNLQQFVADAFGTFDPFADAPVEIVTGLLQGLLPELGVDDAREVELRIINRAGEKTWISDAIERVGQLQERLLAPDLDPAVVPYAADILAEGLFNEEQRISGHTFAFRGRLIYSRPAAGGYRWTIRDDAGTHGPSDEVFETREASNRDAIAAIESVDLREVAS